MACGRPKNLEIAARNPLCGPGDGRRNSPTTGTVTGEGETRATGKGETPSHPARGKPRATRQWAILRPLAKEEPGATRQGGKPPSYPAKGKLRVNWRRGNPESCGEKKALSHLGEGKT